MRRAALLLWLSAAGCDRLLGIHGVSGPDDSGGHDAPPLIDAPVQLPACRAQRVVELIGGNGGLAWFTLAWPMPQVISSFQPGFAYDDPAKAAQVSLDPDHPLFARVVNGRPLWTDAGSAPQPTAFVAGKNETHTRQPESIVAFAGGDDLMAAAASFQTSLEPLIPVITISDAGPFGTAAGAPSVLNVANSAGEIDALQQSGVANIQPSAAQLARYNSPAATANEIELGTALAATANAFAAGAVGTVMIPAYDDNPNQAFDADEATPHALETALSLDAFYVDLAAVDEPLCGTGSGALSMADNTVMVIVGDTPKDSFVAAGWPDGTADDCNYFYVRGNGFLKPGWFGQLSDAGSAEARATFDPTTGVLDIGDVADAADTQAAQAAALFAITRGSAGDVATVTTATFSGVTAP